MRTISRLGVVIIGFIVTMAVGIASAFAGGYECVKPVAPRVTQISCVHHKAVPASIVLPTTEGLTYTVTDSYGNLVSDLGQVAPGTYNDTAVAVPGYMLHHGDVNGFVNGVYTLTINHKTCAAAPVRLPYGHVAVSCGRHVAATIGNRAKANKDVTLYLSAGKRHWKYIVRPGHRRTVNVRAARGGVKVRLGALGKTLDTARSIGACAPTPTQPPGTGL